MSAKVIQLIEVKTTKGEGINGDPVRQVTQYYTFEGTLLFEYDPVNDISIIKDNEIKC